MEPLPHLGREAVEACELAEFPKPGVRKFKRGRWGRRWRKRTRPGRRRLDFWRRWP